MLDEKPSKATIVFVRNRFSDIALPQIPPPEPGDRILYEDKADSPLVVYQKQWKQSLGGSPTVDMMRFLWPEKGLSQQAENLAKEGRLEEAKKQLLELLQGKPHDADSRLQLAEILRAQGDLAGAIEQFRYVVRLYPDAAPVRARLGSLLEEKGDLQAAHDELLQAVRLDEKLVEAQRDLGHVLLRGGKPTEAMQRLERARRLKADDVKTEFLIGEAFVDLGKPDEAKRWFTDFLKKHPNVARAHFHLANIHWLKGESESAVEHYRAAVKADPAWLEPSNNLAWLLATCPDAKLRNGPEALRLAQSAIAKQSANPNAWDTLAAAQAETRDFAAAKQAARRGVELARKQGNGALADKIQARLSLYSSSQAYRQPTAGKP
jgi:predicted Zn-dependent protease